jgi:UDP-glucose 4-epimerase
LETSSGSTDDEATEPLTSTDTVFPSTATQHGDLEAEPSKEALETNPDNDHQSLGTEVEEAGDDVSPSSASPVWKIVTLRLATSTVAVLTAQQMKAP